MNNKSFANVMNQISDEVEAERIRELKMRSRQRIIARIRTGAIFCLGTAAIASGYYYREPLQQFASEKFFNSPKVGQVDATTSAALKGLQTQADKRDQTLNEITK